MLAARSNFSALRLSRSGSPGPAPTSPTSPGRITSSICGTPVFLEDPADRRAARTAIRARRQRCADRLDAGEALAADRRDNGLEADIEAQADDRSAILAQPRWRAGEQGSGGRLAQLLDQPVTLRQEA